MLANVAAGTLITLGVLITVFGILYGEGAVTFPLIGLGAIAFGGLMRTFAPRASA